MARLPQPCPFNTECRGTIEIHPEIETKLVFATRNGTRYWTQVTVNCMLVAECTCCTFCEIAANDTQEFTFEQINNTIPTAMKRKFPSDLKKLIRRRKRCDHVE